MVFGIDKLVAAGVPISVFQTLVQFWQRGPRGKLHLSSGCGKSWQPMDSVRLDPTSIAQDKLCFACGDARNSTQLSLLLDAAANLAAVYPVLGPVTDPGWGDVAVWRGYAEQLHVYCSLYWRSLSEPVWAEARRLRECLTTLEVEAGLTYTDRVVWCDAASLAADIGCAPTPRWPSALREQLSALALQKHHHGPTDGLWFVFELREIAARMRLNGRSWPTVLDQSHRWAFDAVTQMGRSDAAVEAAALAQRFVTQWRQDLSELAPLYGRDALVATRWRFRGHETLTEAGLDPRDWLAPLLAPAGRLEQLLSADWAFFALPEPVARTICSGLYRGPHVEIEICGPAEPGDSPKLYDTLRRLIDECGLSPADGLVAARGILAPKAA